MKQKNKSGFSLVEIMISTLVLAVLAIGGASALYHTGAVIQDQALKRLAIDQAMERLEMAKRTRYSIMRPGVPSQTFYFVDRNGDGENLLESRELSDEENVETRLRFPMVTRISRIPPPGPAPTEAEYLLVGVSVTYNRAGQQVMLESVIVPDL